MIDRLFAVNFDGALLVEGLEASLATLIFDEFLFSPTGMTQIVAKNGGNGFEVTLELKWNYALTRALLIFIIL